MHQSPFEIAMLVCFGASWPVSLRKTIMTRTRKGKSRFFLLLVFVGYVAGVLHKMVYNLDWVVYLYALNGVMVLADLLLCHFYCDPPAPVARPAGLAGS